MNEYDISGAEVEQVNSHGFLGITITHQHPQTQTQLPFYPCVVKDK